MRVLAFQLRTETETKHRTKKTMQTPEGSESPPEETTNRRELLMSALAGLSQSFSAIGDNCRELSEALAKVDELPDSVVEMQLELCRTLAAKL